MLIDDLQTPRHANVGGGGHDGRLVELPEEGLGGRAREREVASLEGPERADHGVRVGLRLHDRGAALGCDLLGDRERVRVHACSQHECRAGSDHVELFTRDRRDRRPQPTGVLKADTSQHLHPGRDHVGCVVAATESCFNDGHLHPLRGQLRVGGGSQQLELRDRVIAAARAIDLLGPAQRPLDRVGHLLRRDVLVVDADALVKADEVR